MAKEKKERLDQILVEKGFYETKSKAQSAIMAGNVLVNNNKITKAGFLITSLENIHITAEKLPYVSRGGFKLEKALKEFNIELNEKICIDAGASTGGFTDCMLQNGAKYVYAIDVGYGQIDWKLRSDDRVKVIERTNIRNCSIEKVYGENIDKKAQFASMDLSFISITKVLSNIKSLMTAENIEIVALIKPQFEAGKEHVPKSGVVKDKGIHFDVIKKIVEFSQSIDLYTQNLTFSPIKGPAGNIEYLLYLTNEKNEFDDDKIKLVTEKAFGQLNDTKLEKQPNIKS
jgi:23S rRNA (cytidine1920-2'-O)/16S rRNA (cytidine1409-2'-O)-methyltransferase